MEETDLKKDKRIPIKYDAIASSLEDEILYNFSSSDDSEEEVITKLTTKRKPNTVSYRTNLINDLFGLIHPSSSNMNKSWFISVSKYSAITFKQNKDVLFTNHNKSKSEVKLIKSCRTPVKPKNIITEKVQNAIEEFTGKITTSLEQELIRIVKTKEGSKYLQKLLTTLPSECIHQIFKIIYYDLIELLNHHYANYFIQQLYFKVNPMIRNEILKEIIENIEFLFSSNGQCSVIFIIENITVDKEKKKIGKLLQETFLYYFWDINYLRILECVMCCIPLKYVKYIRDFALENFSKLIKIREGYFLLRSLIKTCKEEPIQELIISLISKDFLKFVRGSNGSLLCQCIIHNFPLNQYTHNKSCSKYVEKEEVDEKEELDKIIYDENNKSTRILIKQIFKHIDYWDEKSFKPLLECAIINSKSIFQNRFFKSIKDSVNEKTNPVYLIMLLEDGINMISLIIEYFSLKNQERVILLIREFMRLFDKKQRKKWEKLLKTNEKLISSSNIPPVKKPQSDKIQNTGMIAFNPYQHNSFYNYNNINNQIFNNTGNIGYYPYMPIQAYSNPHVLPLNYYSKPVPQYSNFTQSTQADSNKTNIMKANSNLMYFNGHHSNNPK